MLLLQIGHALFDALSGEKEADQGGGRSRLFDVFFREPAEQGTVSKKRSAVCWTQRFGLHASDRQFCRRHARAVLVDMEPKVVNRAVASVAGSSTSWSYAPGCCFSQQSGSGNNWGRGYSSYGPTVVSNVCDLVRREVRNPQHLRWQCCFQQLLVINVAACLMLFCNFASVQILHSCRPSKLITLEVS